MIIVCKPKIDNRQKQLFEKGAELGCESIQIFVRNARTWSSKDLDKQYKKDYDKAISYFKTSAMLYDKGWWMPKLLLHSAMSFEQKNDIDNAANFYNTLINIYPDSKEAGIAKKNLK